MMTMVIRFLQCTRGELLLSFREKWRSKCFCEGEVLFFLVLYSQKYNLNMLNENRKRVDEKPELNDLICIKANLD